MKIKDYDNNVKVTDFENFLDIYDRYGKLSYNLNSTIHLDVSDSSKKEYVLKTDAYWTVISYNIYGTTRLAWLLMKLNYVGPDQMFNKKFAGDKITYISKENVQYILQSII